MQCRGAKSFVDDLGLSRGVVLSRAAASLRSIETKPYDWEICPLWTGTSPRATQLLALPPSCSLLGVNGGGAFCLCSLEFSWPCPLCLSVSREWQWGDGGRLLLGFLALPPFTLVHERGWWWGRLLVGFSSWPCCHSLSCLRVGGGGAVCLYVSWPCCHLLWEEQGAVGLFACVFQCFCANFIQNMLSLPS